MLQFAGDHGGKLTKYAPIKSYAAIGNTRTAALVCLTGSIDWCCLPRFDSPSIFAKILDAEKGGRFSLRPLGRFKSTQAYDEDTNILRTTFLGQHRTVQITDFMPVSEVQGRVEAAPEIHRRVKCIDEPAEMFLEFYPRFDYGRKRPSITIQKNGLKATVGNESLLFTSSPRGRVPLGRSSRFKLKTSESVWLSLYYLNDSHCTLASSTSDLERKLAATEKFWRKWIAGCQYSGNWRDLVRRSALTLKLLSYSPTGAIVAAATTSLPEVLGGTRNWDYRYSWVRDSCFALWSLKRLGFVQEGNQFLDWLLQKWKRGVAERQIMFGVEGERELKEVDLIHLDGYRRSRPVRVGNAAHSQFQLDIYGEILDAIYFLHHQGKGVPEGEYEAVRELADFICKSYDKPDCGIWEVRNTPRPFVYSKLWCWVGLERASIIARELRCEEDAARWSRVMRTIKKEILTRGWCDSNQCFRQHYDTTEPDSANLLMPLVGFLKSTHPKFKKNLYTTLSQLGQDGFLYRYKTDDGLPGEEGTFSLCTLWAVACLARAGKVREATRLFQKVLENANHVGLYSEEFDPVTGEALGNFPQAFTHLNLINAALELDAAMAHAS